MWNWYSLIPKLQYSILTTKKMFSYKKTSFTFYIFYLQSLLKPYLLVQMYAFDFYLQQIY
ncbi:hypothetical protein BK734_23965 [Bacillus thuringiensis serovar kim]|nr:hypothetical protein BK734_23965 [Bacillus thuringiensis serovar kim]